MTAVNLIPIHRRNARRRRVRLRRWVAGAAAYAILLVIGYGACRTVWATGGDLTAELDDTAGQIDLANEAIAALGKEMAQARLMLGASQRLVNQPDWSVLLVLISETLDDKIVLKRCRLQPLAEQRPGQGPTGYNDARTPGIPPSQMPNAFVLALNGYGQSSEDVSSFVLRLEQTGLFAQVTVRHTNREPFLANEAIAFELVCTLEHKGDTTR